MLASVHLTRRVCVFRAGRVILDRPECSQPISQHHCDTDLSARRRRGGGGGGGGGGLWGEGACGKERVGAEGSRLWSDGV